jgi:hypothetical protein
VVGPRKDRRATITKYLGIRLHGASIQGDGSAMVGPA